VLVLAQAVLLAALDSRLIPSTRPRSVNKASARLQKPAWMKCVDASKAPGKAVRAHLSLPWDLIEIRNDWTVRFGSCGDAIWTFWGAAPRDGLVSLCVDAVLTMA